MLYIQEELPTDIEQLARETKKDPVLNAMYGYVILLKQLHVKHMEIAKSKGFTRSYFWWPKLESDIERLCKSSKIPTKKPFIIGHMRMPLGEDFIYSFLDLFMEINT